MRWGFTQEEQAEHAREDAEYLALRQQEDTEIARRGELLLQEERIYEQMRALDRAFGG
jgi:hypothetical protein